MAISFDDFLKTKPPQIETAKQIVIEVKSGTSKGSIISSLCEHVEEHFSESQYAEQIEDLIAAMEGYCSSDYMLHPSMIDH